MQLGKYSNDRDSALHFLCSSGWGNDSFGDVEAPTGYVYRITNSWEEVKPLALDFTSVIEEWLEQEGLKDSEEFRKSLVGHFLIQEDNNGLVHVREYTTQDELVHDFQVLANEYENWNSQEED